MSVQTSRAQQRKESMGTGREVDSVKRRAELIDWLSSILPEFDAPSDVSEASLRECLADGTVFCNILTKLVPGIMETEFMFQGSSISLEQRPNNVRTFLSVIKEMGLSGFDESDLDQGNLSQIVDCLLTLRSHFNYEITDDGGNDTSKFSNKLQKNLKISGSDGSAVAGQGKYFKDKNNLSPVEERRKGATESRVQNKNSTLFGQKFPEVFQHKRGSYSELPAAKISEMMHSSNLDNAPTQSLLGVVYGILDESIERKKGEIPHRVIYLLRKVVQEIERRISTQSEHIKNQNNLIKSREEKFRSRIKALETLVDGTNEENQIVMGRLELIKEEKSKIEEKSKLREQDVARLIREKENAENVISTLRSEMEMGRKKSQLQCEQIQNKARETEVQLSSKIEELEYLLTQSNKRTEELETDLQLKSEIWSRREYTYRHFVDIQLYSVQDLKISSESIKREVLNSELRWNEEISNLGLRLKGLVDAAENYHRVLAENQKLFNEVQELKGNIRVYCRIRPFLPGQNEKSTTIDYVGENGELLISNPLKQGKDGHRMFKFNKVFGAPASQVEVFSDIQPLIRSVLDGYNVCIFAYGQTGSGKTYTMSGPGTSKEDWGVNYRALNDLFEISIRRRNAFLYEVGVQMVEIYNEQVRDLLTNDFTQRRLGIWSTSQPNGLVVPDASLHPVTSTSDVLDLMEIGQANRAVGSTALNERSSRSHSILTVHVRGMDLKNGSTTRGCLHLIDLAGSERVERSEATGDRLKEAQHINKSLSALGDVIFALAQKSSHVPYRNSKLTQVLQSSLGGQAKTLMFVQINPDIESYSETISTLKFAERVSGVELGAARSNKEGKDIKDLLEQVSSLKDTIARKDEEIEQLLLLKDRKIKSPGLSIERNGVTLIKYSSAEVTHTNYEMNGEEGSRNSAADTELSASADADDKCSEGSDCGLSMDGETDGSVNNGVEITSTNNAKSAERMTGRRGQRIHSLLPRAAQSVAPKASKPRDNSKIPSRQLKIQRSGGGNASRG